MLAGHDFGRRVRQTAVGLKHEMDGDGRWVVDGAFIEEEIKAVRVGAKRDDAENVDRIVFARAPVRAVANCDRLATNDMLA